MTDLPQERRGVLEDVGKRIINMGMVEFIDLSKDMESKKIQDLEVINIGYEDCPPGYGYGPTLRPYHLIHFVTEGCGKLEIGQEEYSVHAGDAFFIPAEQVAYYEGSVSHPWTYSWIGFTGTRSKNIARLLMKSSKEQYVLHGLEIDKYRQVIQKGAEIEEVSVASHYLANSVLYQVAALLYRELQKKENGEDSFTLADEVKSYLDSKYTEDLQMQEVAGAFHIHPNYMSQIFRDKYGISPKQYLMGMKLDKAKDMLITTDLPVLLIAASLGFADQLSFSRTFKGRVGISPTGYRRAKSGSAPPRTSGQGS